MSQHKIFAIRPEVTAEAVEALRPKKCEDKPLTTPPWASRPVASHGPEVLPSPC